MGSIGAEELLNRYGSHLGVAEAYLRGELDQLEQRFVPEVVSQVDLTAARLRIELARSKQAKVTSMQAMVAAIQNGTNNLCVIKWTGRKGLKVVATTYCGDHVNAADGVLQLPVTTTFCPQCVAALGA